MFLSLEQINRSIHRLNQLHPFFGTAYLAFKQVDIPVGKTTQVIFSRITTDILEQYYQPIVEYKGFYSPFITSDKADRWLKPRYGSTSLQRITADTFGDALYHPKKSSEWGWKEDYIERLLEHLGSERIPAFDLAVWLFRTHAWPNDVTPEQVRDHLYSEFNIDGRDIERLFDSSIPNISNYWLSENPISEDDLLEIIGAPPGAKPAEGAALRFIELHEIGPTKFFSYEPAERLNIITGDNSLGKTFLLETVWWALTGEWLSYPAVPRGDTSKNKPKIVFAVSTPTGRSQDFTASYDWDKQDWKTQPKREAQSGLLIYARYDGSFAVWDPARSFLREENLGLTSPEQLLFTRDDVWNGLLVPNPSRRAQWLCNGLIRDWVTWQTGGERYKDIYQAFVSSLTELSPLGVESLSPGQPRRLTPADSREFPTLKMPYGEVTVVHASAGVQRILALAYLMVWAWHEHLANSSVIRRDPQRRLVLIVDEIEAHLHPLWQRVIVPAVMQVVSKLASELAPQVHLATHSPMVMASAETIFDEKIDDLHHLRLLDRNVVLEELPFVKRGKADLWLISDVFGLKHARSLPAAKAIEDAKALQLSKDVLAEDVKEVNARLVKYLAPDDDFWPRWRFFAEQFQTNL